MRVTSITEYLGRPGIYLEWPMRIEDSEASEVPPSFNQSFHLSAALNDSQAHTSTVWIAVAFDVEGTLDVDALTAVFDQFVARHPALRTSFFDDDGAIRRRIHGADHVHVDAPHAFEIADPDALTAHVRLRMDHLCHPSRTPSYSFAAVSRSDSSTIICAFDHAHVDAMSMAIAADELSTLYRAAREGNDVTLDPTGSFVEYCALEADTPPVDPSDHRIEAWSRFIGECGGTTPSFPFDLGVAAGELVAQATTVHAIGSASDTAQLERTCRTLGAGMFAGIAAAVAEASATISGPRRLPFLFPLHTRHDPEWAHAIGWFTTNAPMTVTVGTDFAETLASAYSSFRAALPLGTVPIPRVLDALGSDFRRGRQDVFMISYIDYTGLPGAGEVDRRAHHISNVTTADDAQFWISRTHEGLFLRSRFPDTPQAHAVVEDFVRALVATIRSIVEGSGSHSHSLVRPNA